MPPDPSTASLTFSDTDSVRVRRIVGMRNAVLAVLDMSPDIPERMTALQFVVATMAYAAPSPEACLEHLHGQALSQIISARVAPEPVAEITRSMAAPKDATEAFLRLLENAGSVTYASAAWNASIGYLTFLHMVIGRVLVDAGLSIPADAAWNDAPNVLRGLASLCAEAMNVIQRHADLLAKTAGSA